MTAQPRATVVDADGHVLDPTIGICWEGMVDDPKLATAYSRAYSRSRRVLSRRSRAPARVAQISLLDPEGAVAETVMIQRPR